MDWLRNIVSKLPLESISEAASRLIIWWSQFVADVPPDMLPMYAYIGFSIIVLLLWLFIVKVLPSPIGGMSWLFVFSILLAPGVAAGNSGEVAPASIGVVYGILMKEPGLAMRSLLPILVMFASGLLLGFIWQMIRNIIEKNSERMREQARLEEQHDMQLASANYAQLVEQDTEVEVIESKPVQQEGMLAKKAAITEKPATKKLVNKNPEAEKLVNKNPEAEKLAAEKLPIEKPATEKPLVQSAEQPADSADKSDKD